jgi:hypothetical protein
LTPQDFLMRTLGLAAVAAAVAWVVRRLRRQRGERELHVQRLAKEIVEVARSIDVDLRALPRTTEALDLARRCGECRGRTELLARRRRLNEDALEGAIGQLHDDHRRVVNLRSEVDLLMAARRSTPDSSRVVRFSKPPRSRFVTTGLLTRPSTLGGSSA